MPLRSRWYRKFPRAPTKKQSYKALVCVTIFHYHLSQASRVNYHPLINYLQSFFISVASFQNVCLRKLHVCEIADLRPCCSTKNICGSVRRISSADLEFRWLSLPNLLTIFQERIFVIRKDWRLTETMTIRFHCWKKLMKMTGLNSCERIKEYLQ